MATTPREKSRNWSIRVIAILLLFQAFGLIGVSAIQFSGFGDQFTEAILGLTLSVEQIVAAWDSLLLLILAILAIVAAAAFFLLRSFGWLMAMLLQAATLAYCLYLYYLQKPALIYPVMVYCIVMVLYLNSFGVQTAFRSRSASR